MEKNPTIVNFPVKNLELKDYLKLEEKKKNFLETKNIQELREMLIKHQVSYSVRLIWFHRIIFPKEQMNIESNVSIGLCGKT
jgi:hypothetical protein